MPRSEQRQQKKLALKNRKKQNERRARARAKQELSSTAGIVRTALRGDVVDCQCGGREDLSNGLVTIKLVRSAPRGQMVLASFLLDLWCEGVKDCFAQLVTHEQDRHYDEQMGKGQVFTKITPSTGHAIVATAVDYAQVLGISPHPDFAKLQPLWSDIPVGKLPSDIECGRDGRPCYLAGSHDGPAKQSRIQEALRNSVGEGNYEFVQHERISRHELTVDRIIEMFLEQD